MIRTIAIASLILAQQTGVIAATTEGSADYGADYAFLNLMALSSDFAATKYRIENDSDNSDVNVNIYRLPTTFKLSKNDSYTLNLELAIAYQHTSQKIKTFSLPAEYIDSNWNTQGLTLGLIYQYKLNRHYYLLPSIRFGAANMENIADYHGELTQFYKPILDGDLLNWKSNSKIINAGFGLNYLWSISDRINTFSATLHHFRVSSYNESNSAVSFRESANLLNIKTDIITPTDMSLDDRRIDLIFLLGSNYFFGDNRRTLGHVISYQAGIGAELPIKIKANSHDHIRISAQIQWATNMRSGLVNIGYNAH